MIISFILVILINDQLYDCKEKLDSRHSLG